MVSRIGELAGKLLGSKKKPADERRSSLKGKSLELGKKIKQLINDFNPNLDQNTFQDKAKILLDKYKALSVEYQSLPENEIIPIDRKLVLLVREMTNKMSTIQNPERLKRKKAALPKYLLRRKSLKEQESLKEKKSWEKKQLFIKSIQAQQREDPELEVEPEDKGTKKFSKVENLQSENPAHPSPSTSAKDATAKSISGPLTMKKYIIKEDDEKSIFYQTNRQLDFNAISFYEDTDSIKNTLKDMVIKLIYNSRVNKADFEKLFNYTKEKGGASCEFDKRSESYSSSEELDKNLRDLSSHIQKYAASLGIANNSQTKDLKSIIGLRSPFIFRVLGGDFLKQIPWQDSGLIDPKAGKEASLKTKAKIQEIEALDKTFTSQISH